MAHQYTIYETRSYDWWYDFDSAVNPDYALSNWSIYGDPTYAGVTDGAAQGTLQLNTNGCYFQSTKTLNCTAACLDPPEITPPFWTSDSATYTLQNCMVFPVIAALLAGGNLTQSSVNVARKFNIEPNADLYKNASAGWPVIRNCISEFCAEASNREIAPGCNETGTTHFVWAINGSQYNQDPDARFQNFTLPGSTIQYKLCDHLQAYVNSDIGGIGVFISYVMQMAIVLSAWLLYHWNDRWSVGPETLYFMMFRKGYNRKKAWETAVAHQENRRKSNHSAAIVSALAEFLKTQVFFMIAVQIAAIIAIANPSALDATSWQAVWNNFGLLYDIAFAGCFPVLFTLLVLRLDGRLNGKQALYPIGITIVCVILSSVVWFQTLFVVNAKAQIVKYEGPTLPSCGVGVAPIKYCYSVDWFIQNATANTSRALPMLVFCYVVILCIVVEHVRVFSFTVQAPGEETMVKGNVFDWVRMQLVGHAPTEKFLRRRSTGDSNLAKSMRTLSIDNNESLWDRIRGFILLGTEFAFVALNIILIQDYYRIILPSDNTALQYSNWSLGQVIAVAVWAPVFLEYLWIWIVGPEEGFKFRLPPSRQVSNLAEMDHQLSSGPNRYGKLAAASESSVMPPRESYAPAGTSYMGGYSKPGHVVDEYELGSESGRGPYQGENIGLMRPAKGAADKRNTFVRTTSWGPDRG